jgi:hypothetical protein
VEITALSQVHIKTKDLCPDLCHTKKKWFEKTFDRETEPGGESFNIVHQQLTFSADVIFLSTHSPIF